MFWIHSDPPPHGVNGKVAKEIEVLLLIAVEIDTRYKSWVKMMSEYKSKTLF